MANHRDVWVKIQEAEDEDSANATDRYSTLRESLAPEYADLPSEAIGELIESIYPGVDAEDLENIFQSLRRAGRAVSRAAQGAFPGIIQGATTGAALGPFGALAGGLAGGALSAASGRGRRQALSGRGGRRGLGGRLGGIMRSLPNLRGVAGSVAGLAGSPAAAQLLRTLNQPQVGQALRALAMGGAGRRNVNVGGINVPTAAITTALRSLLEKVEQELHERTAGESTGTPMYLLGDQGEFVVDPTDEHARAERVLELLAHSEAYTEDDERAERESYETFRVEGVDEDAGWSEFVDDEDPAYQARRLYPGVYESTIESE